VIIISLVLIIVQKIPGRISRDGNMGILGDRPQAVDAVDPVDMVKLGKCLWCSDYVATTA
jgi:hypothetical protein